MKRIFLSVVSCFLIGIASTLASNELVIHLTSGTVQRFVLLNEEPAISFSGDNIVVTTSSAEVVYAMEEVSYFNYENNAATAISTVVETNGMSINGDYIAFSGLPAGSKIIVGNTAGQVYITETADTEGNAHVNLTTLPHGVYIVKANNISTKITKK